MSLNNGKCMAVKNNTMLRCQCRAIRNKDFCIHHITKHQYDQNLIKDISNNLDKTSILNNYVKIYLDECDMKIKQQVIKLNEDYSHGLLGISDDWSEVPFIYWFHMDECWWDIRALLKTFAYQLNQSDLENPCPIYPESPFTRHKFNVDDLIEFSKKIKILKHIVIDLEINDAVDIFINLSRTNLSKVFKLKEQYCVTQHITEELSKTLRYKLINYTNSQGSHCGYWIDKKIAVSQFERDYSKFKSIYYMNPSQIYTSRRNEGRRLLDNIRNAEKEEYPF